MPSVKEIVSTILNVSISSIKRVVVLKGYHDDGKTSTLTDLIRQLHEQFPAAWIGPRKFNPERFDVSRLSEGVVIKDSTAVFKIDGVTVLIRTGGDNPSTIVHTFSIAKRYNAQIIVTALKVGEKREERSQTAYRYISEHFSFDETIIDICRKGFRNVDYRSEQEQAAELVKIVKTSISSVRNQKI